MRSRGLRWLVVVGAACGTSPDPAAPADADARPRYGIDDEVGAIRIGPARFTAGGELFELVLPGSTDVVAQPHRPFTLTAGTARHVVDAIEVVAAADARRAVELASSSLPGRWVRLAASDSEGAVLLRVVATSDTGSERDPLGLDTRIVLPLGFGCLDGDVHFGGGGHACSFDHGTLVSFCLTGNCNNAVVHQHPALTSDPLLVGPKLGATLLARPQRPLVGSGFALLTSRHPASSIAFAREVHRFKSANGTTAPTGSSVFLNTPPASSCSGPQFCPESASVAGARAKDLGFDEVQLADFTWLRTVTMPSYGAWDPMPGLPASLAAMRAHGVCPVLHSVQPAIAPSNPLCALDPAGTGQTCPAALRDSEGRFVSPPQIPGLWLSDTRKPWVLEALTRSMTEGAALAGACGTYVDGSDWFLSGDLDGSIYLEEMWRRAPSLRLWANWSHGNAALFMTDIGILDVWQIHDSQSPRAWAVGWGYYAMRNLLEKLGMNARLGWVPTPQPGETQLDYQPMLNAAVASGSFLTLQTDSADPVIAGQIPWAREAIREATAALREIRGTGGAVGVAGPSSARHEVIHFDSGVSTVALFDSIVPAAPGSRLEGRAFGVETVTTPGECGPFTACFWFTGAARMPHDYNLPRLSEKGSFLYHPRLPTSPSFTLAAWIRPATIDSGAGIIERGPLAYGLNYYVRQFSAHFTPADGYGVIGFYEPAYGPLDAGWKHVAITYDASTKTIAQYVDGVLVGSPKAMAWSDAFRPESPIWVGRRGDPWGGFRGWLNDVRVYDRALEASEIENVVDEVRRRGSDAAIPPPDDPSWLIGWSASTERGLAPTIEIDLDHQRVAYLVPILEGTRLPASTVRLVFRGLAAPSSAVVHSEAAITSRTVRADGALVLDVDAASLGITPVRLAVGP